MNGDLYDLWQKWLNDLNHLPDIRIPRCQNISHKSYCQLAHCELHHFADASSRGYGVVSISRLVSHDGQVFCNFVIGKARLDLLKTVSIPELELVAATLAVQADQMLEPNLEV